MPRLRSTDPNAPWPPTYGQWDSPREIASTRLPYWLRTPPRPKLLEPTSLRFARDDETLDLFAEAQ